MQVVTPAGSIDVKRLASCEQARRTHGPHRLRIERRNRKPATRDLALLRVADASNRKAQAADDTREREDVFLGKRARRIDSRALAKYLCHLRKHCAAQHVLGGNLAVFHAVYHVLRAPKTALGRTTGVQTLIYTEEHP